MDYTDVHNWEPGKMVELSTHLEKPSPFYFGFGITKDHLMPELRKHQFDRIFFLTEQNLLELYGQRLVEQFREEFEVHVEVVPPGEKCKDFPVLAETCEKLIAAGISKKSLIVAFGGGTVGNIVGLVAGLIYRGVRFVEISTSMTGQTDSTLSNKQAVNGKTGKNHFGLYHSPLFIWADTEYLKTEPALSKRCGIIEGIKNGFIQEPKLLDYFDEHLNKELDFTDEALTDMAFKIIKSKLEILKNDPTEKHLGIILEYGHTFGHGMEWIAAGKLTHGESVSHGMKIAAELGREMGLLTDEDVARHYYFIEEKLGFANPMPSYITTENLIDAMVSDNKKTGKEIRFVVLEKIGACHNPEGDYLTTVDMSIVRRVLDKHLQSRPDVAAA